MQIKLLQNANYVDLVVTDAAHRKEIKEVGQKEGQRQVSFIGGLFLYDTQFTAFLTPSPPLPPTPYPSPLYKLQKAYTCHCYRSHTVKMCNVSFHHMSIWDLWSQPTYYYTLQDLDQRFWCRTVFGRSGIIIIPDPWLSVGIGNQKFLWGESWEEISENNIVTAPGPVFTYWRHITLNTHLSCWKCFQKLILSSR